MPDSVTTRPDSSPCVALFQKAHQKLVTLQRLDEQLASLLTQRRKLQDDLRDVQEQINDEFERVMQVADQTPARILADIAQPGGNGRMASVE
jgi:hypothetical protein